jgi:TonB family protein
MKFSSVLILSIFVVSVSAAPDTDESTTGASAAPGPVTGTKYLIVRKDSDSHFIQSIERVGPCEVPGPPNPGIRIPWQIYPKESTRLREQGKVTLELKLDPDWCVRKATVTKSSGYWRLDEVTVKFAMSIKTKLKHEDRAPIVDGEPTITIPIVWKLHQGP